MHLESSHTVKNMYAFKQYVRWYGLHIPIFERKRKSKENFVAALFLHPRTPKGPGPRGLSRNYRRIYSLISDMAAFSDAPILRFEERFPYSSKTNRPMNFALNFNVCVLVKYPQSVQSTWLVEQAYWKAILLLFILFLPFHSSADIVGLQVVACCTLDFPYPSAILPINIKKM